MTLSDLNRRIENLIRLGAIAEVGHSARLLRVQSGDLLTDYLPWPVEIGRNYKRWRPLRVGTQVILACIAGEPEQAVIIGTIYSDSLNSPSTNPDVDLIQFDDGSYIEHNASSNNMLLLTQE